MTALHVNVRNFEISALSVNLLTSFILLFLASVSISCLKHFHQFQAGNPPRAFNKSFSFLAWHRKWTKRCQTKTIYVMRIVTKLKEFISKLPSLTFRLSGLNKVFSMIIFTSVMRVVFTWFLMINPPWTGINIIIDYAYITILQMVIDITEASVFCLPTFLVNIFVAATKFVFINIIWCRSLDVKHWTMN